MLVLWKHSNVLYFVFFLGLEKDGSCCSHKNSKKTDEHQCILYAHVIRIFWFFH